MSLHTTPSVLPVQPSGQVQPLVEVDDLAIKFVSRDATVHAVNGLSFKLEPGQVLCLIGESGSGKTVTMRALMRLLPDKKTVYGGHIRVGSHDILTLSKRELTEMRGAEVSMVFQEPMTALDATVQIQVLSLLRKLQQEIGMSVILVTHDLGVAAQIADKVAVMYAGRIVEYGTAEEVLRRPSHPYTLGLMASIV